MQLQTVSSSKLHLKTLEVCSALLCLDEGHFESAIVSPQYRRRQRLISVQPFYQLRLQSKSSRYLAVVKIVIDAAKIVEDGDS